MFKLNTEMYPGNASKLRIIGINLNHNAAEMRVGDIVSTNLIFHPKIKLYDDVFIPLFDTICQQLAD
jgi:hypothetical protein